MKTDLTVLYGRAEKGNAEACFEYGLRLLRREGQGFIPADLSRAESYLYRAARLGDEDAKEFLRLYKKFDEQES